MYKHKFYIKRKQNLCKKNKELKELFIINILLCKELGSTNCNGIRKPDNFKPIIKKKLPILIGK